MSAAELSMPLDLAERAAAKIADALRPVCRQVHIAGSVRRRKPDAIHDIDIVAVPNPAPSLYGDVAHEWSHEFIRFVQSCPLWMCDSHPGVTSRQIKIRARKNPLLKIELWLATPGNVGVILLIRTGPDHFTQPLVAAARSGRIPAGLGYTFGHPVPRPKPGHPDPVSVRERERHSGWLVYTAGLTPEAALDPARAADLKPERVRTPTERDVFFELGLPVVAPERRGAESLEDAIAAGRKGAA